MSITRRAFGKHTGMGLFLLAIGSTLATTGCNVFSVSISPALFNFSQRPRAYLSLPSDSDASSGSYKNTYTRQNNGPNFKTGRWFTFPLSCVCLGVGMVFWGVYFTYIQRCNWRLVLGLLGVVAGLFSFIYGLNRIVITLWERL